MRDTREEYYCSNSTKESETNRKNLKEIQQEQIIARNTSRFLHIGCDKGGSQN